ncbi:MAG: cation:proton antiporter [Spirochaetaceae bacterium]|nr:cation:proton antiporter [Spirochaetaceae bacterium]
MEEGIASVMANLVLQLGILIFAVRLIGKLFKKIKVPTVLGELLIGVVIGPFALGGIPLPGFPQGIFPLNSASLAVSPELYSFSQVASIILLFASGLETDLKLFLKYSVAGGVIGIGGVVFSFVLGDLVGVLLLHTNFMDVRCLFLGIMSTATSVGITARILSDKKKMDSPEGVTILASAVFDDVLGIILLAVILGVVAVLNGTGASISGVEIAKIAGKAFGIWLVFTALGLIFSKQIAKFLKFFKHSYDFSICALGLGLLLAGVFEKQGLAMIIGAYVTGLSLSSTDIAPIIQERIRGLYDFFVPIFFAVMGMMVNVGEMLSKEVLIFGAIYTVVAILAKVFGCAFPAMLMGFNFKGGLRIGCGMIPRGEVALIIAGIGLTAGILDEKLFGVVILMTLVTTLVAAPFLNFSLSLPGRGTRKETTTEDGITLSWDFGSDEIADLVVDMLLKNLRNEGFYVQMMNINEGISQARKGSTVLSIKEEENIVTIETSAEAEAFVKTSMYEMILGVIDLINNLKKGFDGIALKKDILDSDATDADSDNQFKKLIKPEVIIANSKAETKDDLLKEMVLLLTNTGNVRDWELVLSDVLSREKIMSTGMEKGIAIPHAKSDGVIAPCVAVCVKKDGIDFGSIDKEPSKIFFMIVSPKKANSPHLQMLASISSIVRNKETLSKILEAKNSDEICKILKEN